MATTHSQGGEILEVGCGSGHWLREFIKWGASPSDTIGVDLRSEALTSAARLCPGGVTLQCMNGSTLDFPDESFDIVLQSLVFTSVLDENMRASDGAGDTSRRQEDGAHPLV